MNALAARRRHPAAIAVLLLIGLFLMGAAYSAVAPRPAEAGVVSQDDVSEGKQLFQANCASCHGLNAEGRKTGHDQVLGGGHRQDQRLRRVARPGSGHSLRRDGRPHQG